MKLIQRLLLVWSICGWSFGPLMAADEEPGRAVMFVGFDISGSFRNTPYFKDAMRFAAYYIYAHIHGLGGAEKLNALFVGSIGGAKPDEPKTFYPLETFQYKPIDEIEQRLNEIFIKEKVNKFTDYNAFFEQVTEFTQNKKLVMKPISVVMFSDGIPDAKINGKSDWRSFKLDPLENLSRNVTVRVLYTDAVTAMKWQSEVPRKRIKIWTQDAVVMKGWKEKDIFLDKVPFEKQERFFSWMRNNVDFPARQKRVN